MSAVFYFFLLIFFLLLLYGNNLIFFYEHTAYSTQHTAHSTQHTAHSTQHTALCWISKHLLLIFFITPFISCENDFEEQKSQSKIQTINEIKLINGVIHINSIESIKSIVTLYRNNEINQNEFNSVIKNFQSEGFRPLEPIFGDNDSELIENFVKRKQIK